MKCCKTGCKVFPFLIVFGGILLGIFAATASQENLHKILIISRFFEAMLPLLVTGALIKYIFCGGSSSAAGKSCCKTTDESN